MTLTEERLVDWFPDWFVSQINCLLDSVKASPFLQMNAVVSVAKAASLSLSLFGGIPANWRAIPISAPNSVVRRATDSPATGSGEPAAHGNQAFAN